MAKFRNGGNGHRRGVTEVTLSPEEALIQQTRQRLETYGIDSLTAHQRKEARRLGAEKIFPELKTLSQGGIRVWNQKYGQLFI